MSIWHIEGHFHIILQAETEEDALNASDEQIIDYMEEVSAVWKEENP
jgi:hypothetical protein